MLKMLSCTILKKEKYLKVELTEQEMQVINIMRDIEYGELMVAIQGGKPVRVEEVRKSIKIK